MYPFPLNIPYTFTKQVSTIKCKQTILTTRRKQTNKATVTSNAFKNQTSSPCIYMLKKFLPTKTNKRDELSFFDGSIKIPFTQRLIISIIALTSSHHLTWLTLCCGGCFCKQTNSRHTASSTSIQKSRPTYMKIPIIV